MSESCSDRSAADADRHERVRAIFFEVCDLRDRHREEALDRLCGNDRALRDAVERLLLRDAPGADIFSDDAIASGAVLALTHGAPGHRVGPIPSGEVEAAADRLPVQIGGYRILRRIGDGGMGTVYEAQQQDPLRVVALKTLQRWSASPSMVRRFRHEAHVLGRLQHPGVAQIFEAGVHESPSRDGERGATVPFFVMELVRGRPITTHARELGLSSRERMELFVKVCAAVAYAHQRGVIHRDLKPDNILVDESGQPKVLDFGIAKTTDSDARPTTIETQAGQLIGTLPYMSPEQVSGDSSSVDIRSDVYALGVVLYELLAEHPPYDVRNRSLPEAVRIIREETHERLSAVSRAFRGDVETIISKALEKQAERRYQSVSELSADVRRYLEHQPIAARPPSTFYQISKFARRHRTLVAGTCGVVLALALGVLVATAFALDAQARERVQRWETYKARVDAASTSLERGDVEAARRHLAEAPPELRGWEWNFLHRGLQQWDVELDCGAQVLGAAGWLPGDREVAAAIRGDGAADDSICAWDIASGRRTRTVVVPGRIRLVGRALSGTRVPVLTDTGAILVVDMAKEDAVSSVEIPGGPDAVIIDDINDLAMSPDGARLFLATRTGVIAWNVADARIDWQHGAGEPSRAPPGVRPGFRGLAVSLDGESIAAAQRLEPDRHSIHVWTTADGAPRPPFRNGDAGATVAFRPGTGHVAISSNIRDVLVVDTQDMTLLRQMSGHRHRVNQVAYSPDGSMLASASHDGSILIRPLGGAGPPLTLRSPEEPIGRGTLVFSADGSRLLSEGERTLYVWRSRADSPLMLHGHDSYPYHVAFSPDGGVLASSQFRRGTVICWDPRAGRAIARLSGAASPLMLQFSDDGSILSARTGRDVRTWNLASGVRQPSPPPKPAADGREEVARPGPALPPRSIMDPTGRLAVLVPQGGGRKGAATEAVRLLDAASGALIGTLGHEASASAAAFSPGGTALAVGCANGEVVIWDVGSAREGGTVALRRLATLAGHTGRVYALGFSPDGRRLASGGNDASLRLWDTVTWDQVLERHDHADYIHDLAFSPDGTQLATASGDGSVGLWDSCGKQERLAQARDDAQRQARMRPWVEELLSAAGDATLVAEAVQESTSLDTNDRRAALHVLIERGEGAAPPDIDGAEAARAPIAAQAVRFPPESAPTDERVEAALRLAGDNRAEIQRFLDAYDMERDTSPSESDGDDGGDEEKSLAARWLVANMPGHEQVRVALTTADGREVQFDPLEHRTLREAEAALEALRKLHGPLEFRTVERAADLRSITADQLIENHELAFEAWRAAQWGDSVSFNLFLEHILPYRGTNEPLDPAWRREAMARMRTALQVRQEEASGPGSGAELVPPILRAGETAVKVSRSLLRFRPTTYLRPTDLDWTRMLACRFGRCEDQVNLSILLARGAGALIAFDSTPWWANRDNNHAWEVPLDAVGRGTAKLRHRAAKVYRRTFAPQAGTLGRIRQADDVVPAWLNGDRSVDVTSQYTEVHDVNLDFGPPPPGARLAYLCVFNGGEWRPICWSEPDGSGRATFADMGCGVLYLPAWFTAQGTKPAGRPFLLLTRGAMQELEAAADEGDTCRLEVVARERGRARAARQRNGNPDDEESERDEETIPDTPGPTAPSTLRVEADADAVHELLVWDAAAGDWRVLERATATTKQPALLEGVPRGGLYWLRAVEGRRLERPFVIDQGGVSRW